MSICEEKAVKHYPISLQVAAEAIFDRRITKSGAVLRSKTTPYGVVFGQ